MSSNSKIFLSVLLAGSLGMAGILKANDRIEPKIGFPGVIFISIVVGGTIGWAIWRIASSIPDDHATVKVVLERSYDHSTWAPIATNTVTLNGSNPIEFFRAQTTDFAAFYRARVTK
jgi:hypothetical protein